MIKCIELYELVYLHIFHFKVLVILLRFSHFFVRKIDRCWIDRQTVFIKSISVIGVVYLGNLLKCKDLISVNICFILSNKKGVGLKMGKDMSDFRVSQIIK